MSCLPELNRLHDTLDDATGLVDRLSQFEPIVVEKYEEEIQRAQNNLIKLRGKVHAELAAAECRAFAKL